MALPVLIHGDAAFPGQGVVAETLNLQSLEGYSTGGTLHLITNNQVGYTTDPTESRSTRYSSDLAKGFDVPIVHVNADDPEAALSAVRLAARLQDGVRPRLRDRSRRLPALRPQRAGRRVVHATADGREDPAQPTVRAVYAARLVEEGVLSEAEAEAFVHGGHRHAARGPRAAPQRHRQGGSAAGRPGDLAVATTGDAVVTAVAADRLRALNDQLLAVPDGFTINAKLAKQLERRHEMIERGRDRLGPGRGARLRLAARGRDPGPPLRPGRRARHVRTPPPGLPRPVLGRDVCADPAPAGGQRLLRGLQLAALGVRGARFRVRLLGRGARRSRALGGPVRRLRQRRPDRDRPVPRRRALEVGPDVTR